MLSSGTKTGGYRSPRPISTYASGEQREIPYTDIPNEPRELISKIFERYSAFSTHQLVTLSHATGGPWDIVFQAHLADKTMSSRIPNDLIRQHYVTGQTKSRECALANIAPLNTITYFLKLRGSQLRERIMAGRGKTFELLDFPKFAVPSVLQNGRRANITTFNRSS